MKKEKLGFFKKLFLVITDFRTYPFLVKHEKFYKSLLYLITLIFIVSIIFTTNLIAKFNTVFQNLIDKYDEKIPEFELSDGVLTVFEKYNLKINSENVLIVNTDYTYEEYRNTEEYGKLVVYDTVTLVNKDKIMVEFEGEPLEFLDGNFGVIFEKIDFDLDKNLLYEELTREYDLSFKIIYLLNIYLSIFISYFIVIFFKMVFLAFIISIICFFTGVRLDFKNYLKIAIYTYTLPLIVELIATCIVGSGKDYTYYTTLLLSYVYMIYAIRAVRLDAFIMMFSRKENLKHTPKAFRDELKKYEELINDDENSKDDTKNEEKDEEKKE